MKITKQAAQIILSAMMILFAASLAFDIRSDAGVAPVVDSIVLLLLAWAGLIASRMNLIVGSVLLLVSAAVPVYPRRRRLHLCHICLLWPVSVLRLAVVSKLVAPWRKTADR